MYRIYMSVRIAATCEQVADITVLRNVHTAQLAESYVESFSSPDSEFEYMLMLDSIASLWNGCALLVCFMKEVQK